MFKRAPGTDYFYALEDVGEAVMKELPFEDRTGLAEKTFDEMEAGQIAEKIGTILEADAVIDPEQTDAHYCWRLQFYGQNGKILYEFEQDADGAVYENHYRIHSPELEDYFNELIWQAL